MDDLLDVTRISRGKVELKRLALDARDIVRAACDDHRALFEQRNVELRFDDPARSAWVNADADRLSQVLGNLLQNSAKFTPPGGTVVVSVGVGNPEIEIRVRDTGIGLDPQQLERMFEPFAQAENTLARTNGGLGLGLALVKGLVELHGGRVGARSEGVGHGCELVVTLPRADPPAVRSALVQNATGAAGKFVLVIEDNVDAAQTLGDILELGGHRVLLARDGASGIKMARELKPDVVLCDVGLPDVNGYEVARSLRSDDSLRGTLLVAVSGYALFADKQKAIEAGFDAHLTKPPDLDKLNDLLTRR